VIEAKKAIGIFPKIRVDQIVDIRAYVEISDMGVGAME
jgi:hypothetical protein